MSAHTVKTSRPESISPEARRPLAPGRESGWVMITTLLTLLLMTSLGILYFTMVNRDVIIAGHYFRESQAFHAADAGFTITMGEINNKIFGNLYDFDLPGAGTPVNPADPTIVYRYCVNRTLPDCAATPPGLSEMTDNVQNRPGFSVTQNFGSVGFYAEVGGLKLDPSDVNAPGEAAVTIASLVRGLVDKDPYPGGKL